MREITLPITEFLIARRVPLMLLALVLAAVLYRPSMMLRYDRSVENMFAQGDPLLVSYQRLKKIFGGNEVVLAVYDDPLLLEEEGLERLGRRSTKLARVAGVRTVMSLDQLLLDKENPAVQQLLNLARGQLLELFEGYTHSTDGRTAAIVCILAHAQATDVTRRETIAALREQVAAYNGMIAGEPVMVVDGYRYLEQDAMRLGWLSTLLMGMTILVCFRSLRWVILPLVIVHWTLILTRSTIWWAGLHLSIVSSTLTAVVTVVGVATVIHFIVRFREAGCQQREPRAALTRAGHLLAAPIFWACATDAVGFFSLQTARVGPVRDFGVIMAVGCLLVVPAVALMLPGLALAGSPSPSPLPGRGEQWLARQLTRLLAIVIRWPAMVGTAVFLLASVPAAGIGHLEVESDFTSNFRAASPIVKAYRFVEERLGGAGVWDIIVPVPERLGSQVDRSFLNHVLALERRLREEVTVQNESGDQARGLTKVISLASTLAAGASPVMRSDQLPEISESLLPLALSQLRQKNPGFLGALHAPDPDHPDRYYVRILLRAREQQPSSQKKAIIQQVTRISREEFPDAKVTGFYVLLTNLIDSTLSDQWKTFAVAIVSIGLMMLIAFRNGYLALIALVPNILPILMVMGMMGWLGVRINMGAAMIAAVSVGLSIDSSIHYITAFLRSRREGCSLDNSLAAAQQAVGRALLLATLALIIGFSALCTSQFVPTIYFGALVSLAMLGGLAGNLVVLPLLIKLLVR